jgi:ferrous iron transport protein A
MPDPDFHPMPLGAAKKGFRGVIVAVGFPASRERPIADEFNEELERRLLEIGFVEGARIEILHEGLIGGDPIAIRVDDMSVALRRHEANAILVSAPMATSALSQG